jgi:hypothetical protein
VADARPNASSSEFVRANETMLRTKYLDYCSAQVAEHLLALSPDEIYLLAEATHRRDGAPGDDAPSYDRMVQMATEGIVKRLALPEFERWAEDFARDPARYESDLLGFWDDGAGDGVTPN